MSLNFDWLWVYVTVSVVKGSLLDKGVKKYLSMGIMINVCMHLGIILV